MIKSRGHHAPMRHALRGGLTLLELLAAVVILSAAAAGFASVARDASATLRDVQRSGDLDHARFALEVWETSRPDLAGLLAELAREADERGAPVTREWAFTVDGARWRVRAEAEPRIDPQDEPEWTLRTAWATLRAAREGQGFEDGAESRRLVPLPPLADSLPTGAPGGRR